MLTTVPVFVIAMKSSAVIAAIVVVVIVVAVAVSVRAPVVAV
jgi:hypothetical protein